MCGKNNQEKLLENKIAKLNMKKMHIVTLGKPINANLKFTFYNKNIKCKVKFSMFYFICIW